jgi:hypothetical protein
VSNREVAFSHKPALAVPKTMPQVTRTVILGKVSHEVSVAGAAWKSFP